jgi:hypothetical protein
VPNRPQIIQPLDVQIARAVTPVAGDGRGNYYVLAKDGTVGFVDTMKDPDRLDRQVASDLLSFVIELLAHDREVDRTRN